MTQNEKVLDYMRQNGSITPLDAMREFGCMRLASRISDLKAEGHQIEKEMEKSTNRYGDVIRHARYRLHEMV